MSTLIDLTKTPFDFGDWSVMARGPSTPRKQSTWWCCCGLCGTIHLVLGDNLRSGGSRNCGCPRVSRLADLARTHGMTETPEYEIWCGIKKRCSNPQTLAYKNYGAVALRSVSVGKTRLKPSLQTWDHDPVRNTALNAKIMLWDTARTTVYGPQPPYKGAIKEPIDC